MGWTRSGAPCRDDPSPPSPSTTSTTSSTTRATRSGNRASPSSPTTTRRSTTGGTRARTRQAGTYVVQGRIIDWQKYNEWNDMVKRRHFYCGIWTSETVDRPLGAWDSAGTAGLGSWTLTAHHPYDPLEKVVHLGDGSQLRSEVIGPTVSTVAGLGTTLNGDNIDASDARFNYLGELAIGPDGSMYTWDHFEDWLFKIDPKGKIRKYAGVGGDYDYYAWDGIPQCDGRQATKAILGTVSSMAAAPDGILRRFAGKRSGGRERPGRPRPLGGRR